MYSIVQLCILILCGYGITNTALGNAGLNVKPVYISYFEELQDIIKNMHQGVYYRSNENFGDTIKQHTINNIHDIKSIYKQDMKYSLCNTGFLKCKGSLFKKNLKSYHKLTDLELEIYQSQFSKLKKKSVEDKVLLTAIENFFDTVPSIKNRAIAHFIIHAQNYLVQQGILNPKQYRALDEVVNNIKNTRHKELTKTLANIRKNVDSSSSVSRVLGMLSGLLTIVGIGGLSYEVGKKNTIMNMTRDIKDNTHMSLFGILSITCSVTVTLVLCMAVAYHIINKKKPDDIVYNVIGMV